MKIDVICKWYKRFKLRSLVFRSVEMVWLRSEWIDFLGGWILDFSIYKVLDLGFNIIVFFVGTGIYILIYFFI